MTMDPRPATLPAAPHRARARPAPPFEAVLDVADLPPGAMRRVTRGDLDILLAHTPAGIVATDDRCPHMSAPLSIGELDGCVVACPLHEGRFDLCTGETGPDADDRRARRRRRLPPDLVAGRSRAEGRPARQEGRGAPADPRPAAPLLPGADRRRPDRDRVPGAARARPAAELSLGAVRRRSALARRPG